MPLLFGGLISNCAAEGALSPPPVQCYIRNRDSPIRMSRRGDFFLQLALVSHVTAIRKKIRFLAIILAILLQTIIDVTTHSSSNEDLACILHNYATHDVHEMYLACMIFASQLQSANCSAQIRRELSSKDMLKKNPSNPYQFSLLTPHCPNCLSHAN